MGDEGLSEEGRRELQEAIRIARSDGLHIHKTYPAFLKAQREAEQAEKDKPTDGSPPPVKDKPEPEYDEIVGLWGKKRVARKAKDDTAS